MPKRRVVPFSEGKGQYIQGLFSQIAGDYDRINRVMSLGMDLAWRCSAAQKCALQPGQLVLDVATGTGDLAFALAQKVKPNGQVIGLDFTPQMLAVARQKAITNDPHQVCQFLQGDALQLPFPDHAFHAATIGFTLRNVENISTCLAQMHRVVKPGGRVVCLELAKPQMPFFRQLHAVYLRLFIPCIGYLGHGVAEPYTYLAGSLTHFANREQLAQQMCDVGFKQVHYEDLLGGVVTIHVGVV